MLEVSAGQVPEYEPRTPESYWSSPLEQALAVQSIAVIHNLLQSKPADDITFLGVGVGSGAFEQSLFDLSMQLEEKDPIHQQLQNTLRLSNDDLKKCLSMLNDLHWKVTDIEGPENQNYFRGIKTLHRSQLNLLKDPFPSGIDLVLARGVLHHIYSDCLPPHTQITPQTHYQSIGRIRDVLRGMARAGVTSLVGRDPVLSEGDPFEMVDVVPLTVHGQEILQEYLLQESNGRRRLVDFDYEAFGANHYRFPRIIRDDLLNYANFSNRESRMNQKEEIHAYLSATDFQRLCQESGWQLTGSLFDYQDEVRGHFEVGKKELLVFTIHFTNPSNSI